MIPTFRNRIGLWLIRLAVLVPLFLSIGYFVFEAGGCTLGLTHRGDCSYIPVEVGEIALISFISAYVIALFVSPFLAGVGIVMELCQRYFDRRGDGQNNT